MSTLKVNTIQDASGSNASTSEQIAQGRAKAWVNFNATGTAAIRDSFNVSSITDLDVGRFTVAFSSNMPNSNYAVVASGGNQGTAAGMAYMYSPTTSQTNVENVTATDQLLDSPFFCVAVFGD